MISTTPRPIHDLKTCPDPFRAVLSGVKKYEVRKQDRDFQVGDYLRLLEHEPGRQVYDSVHDVLESQEYTGRHVMAVITYITHGGAWGMPPDLCVLGIEVVKHQAY